MGSAGAGPKARHRRNCDAARSSSLVAAARAAQSREAGRSVTTRSVWILGLKHQPGLVTVSAFLSQRASMLATCLAEVELLAYTLSKACNLAMHDKGADVQQRFISFYIAQPTCYRARTRFSLMDD